MKIKNFNQNAIVFNFETFKDVEKNAKQYFLEDSILALLPISPRTISVVWSCNQDFFKKLNDMSDSKFKSKLKSIIDYQDQPISTITYFAQNQLMKEVSKKKFKGVYQLLQ